MVKLVLIHESGAASEYELKPGPNTVGRSPDNNLSIDHDSVSDCHCEIHKAPDGVWVRDLGSAQGTWIDTIRIEEAKLDSGQTLQIGEIQFVLEMPVRVGAKAASASPGVFRAGAASPGTATPSDSVYCGACAQWHALGATTEQRVGASLLHFCPQCGGQCVTAHPGQSADDEVPEIGFTRGVLEAFGYPFRGNGGWMVFAGGVALILTHYLMKIAAYAPILGFLAVIILSVMVTGYFFAFMKDVLSSSAQGLDTLPGWPEITSPEDFSSPFFQFLALNLVCFGPLLIWMVWGPEGMEPWATVLIGLVGITYFPMALVGIALSDSIGGLNPIVVIPSILRIPGHYLLAVILVAFLFGVQLGGDWLGDALPVPFISVVLTQFLTLYLLVVTARVLGILCYVNRRALGWFR